MRSAIPQRRIFEIPVFVFHDVAFDVHWCGNRRGKLQNHCTSIYSSVENSENSVPLAGYCDPAQEPGKSRIVVIADKAITGTDSLIAFPDIASCELARNAIIDSGLGVQLRPADCRISQDPQIKVALEFMISNPYSSHV